MSSHSGCHLCQSSGYTGSQEALHIGSYPQSPVQHRQQASGFPPCRPRVRTGSHAWRTENQHTVNCLHTSSASKCLGRAEHTAHTSDTQGFSRGIPSGGWPQWAGVPRWPHHRLSPLCALAGSTEAHVAGKPYHAGPGDQPGGAVTAGRTGMCPRPAVPAGREGMENPPFPPPEGARGQPQQLAGGTRHLPRGFGQGSMGKCAKTKSSLFGGVEEGLNERKTIFSDAQSTKTSGK